MSTAADRSGRTDRHCCPDALSASQRRLVEEHLVLARSLARRFAERGESLGDLQQVAYLELSEAARRFDPEQGVAFSTYATVSVLGALKRHFRDHSWSMHVSRRTQELYLATKHANADLEQRLGRPPTVAEVATALGSSEEKVLEAMEAGREMRSAPLPGTDASGDDSQGEPADDDPGFERTVERETLRTIMAGMDPRDRDVLTRYFLLGQTQRQIGDGVGVSQMQVSRILGRALARLRQLANG